MVTIDAASVVEMVIVSSHPSAYPIRGHGELFGVGFSPAQGSVETNSVRNSSGSTHKIALPKVIGSKKFSFPFFFVAKDNGVLRRCDRLHRRTAPVVNFTLKAFHRF